MGKILIVDDDAVFLKFLADYIKSSYSLLDVETCTSVNNAIDVIRRNKIDLLLVSLEVPMLDDVQLFKYAVESGIDKNRIVILSSRDPEYLHDHFPMGTCLAVLNKYEAKQKDALNMILSSMQRKAAI